MQFWNPSEIKIPEGRFRVVGPDDPEVITLADSMKEVGQLHPILITEDRTLVAGMCRLMACKRLGRRVWCVTEKDGELQFDPTLRRVAEFQENFRRSNFTPVQESLAIAEVDRLMRELYGSRKAAPGAQEGWAQQDTAEKLGFKSHRTVSDALAVAKLVKAGTVPEIAEVKTMTEAVKMVRDITKIEALKELARRSEYIENPGEIKDPLKYFQEKLLLGDCLEQMQKLPREICSMFITDPPWGIGVDKKVEAEGSVLEKVQGNYKDDEQSILPLLNKMIKEMHRIGCQDCWAVIFCGARFWHTLRDACEVAGFSVYKKPLVWVRTLQDGTVANMKSGAPTMWPASVTDFMILAKKGNPTLAELNRGDAFLHPVVPPGLRIHQAQKPIGLMEQIISRFYHPGTNPLLIDPFAGSASTLIAAHRLGIKQVLGYEIDPEFRERAVAYMVQCYLEDQKQMNEVDLEDFK